MWIWRFSEVWREVRSKLILNTPIINDKNRKIALEILFGLTQHSTKQYLQMLQKYFFDWSADIFQSPIVYIKFSTQTQCRLVTAICKIYPKNTYERHNSQITSTPCNQLTLCNCREKEECPMDGKYQTMDVMYDCRVTVVSLHQSREKFSLGKQKENGRKSITNIKIHSTTHDIHRRRHFQAMGGIWRKLLAYPR